MDSAGDVHDLGRAAPVLDRPRLLGMLDTAAPLTVVRGPLGAGAGVLVEQWLAAGGADGTRLVRFDEEPAEGYVAALQDVRADPRPTTLVLARLRPGDPHRDAAVLALAGAAPHVRCVVTTRGGTLLDVPSRRDGVLIGPEDLAFTVDEAHRLARLLGLDDDAAGRMPVAAVHGRVRGWCAAVVAILTGARSTDGSSAGGAEAGRRAGGPVSVDESPVEPLLTAALDALVAPDGRSAGAVGRLALADEIDEATARAVAVDRSTVQLLVRGGLLEADDDGLATFAPTVRRLLVARLARTEPDLHHDLHVRLAEVTLASGARDRALAHAILAEEWDQASTILQDGMVELMCHRLPLVQRVIELAPPGRMHVEPSMELLRSFLVGILPVHSDRTGTGTVLDVVAARGSDEMPGGLRPDVATPVPVPVPETDRDRIGAALAQVLTLRTLGHVDEAEEVAARSEHLLRLDAEALDLVALARLHWGILRLLRGDLVRAGQDLRASARAARRTGIDFLLRNACGDLALVHALQGDLVAAQGWLDQLDAVPPAGGELEDLSRTGWTVARALVALGRLDLAAAEDLLAELAGAERLVVREELWAFVAYARAELAVLRGDRVGALHALEVEVASHADTCRPGSFVRDLLVGARADLLVALGDGNRARDAVEDAADLPELLRLRRARIDLLTGDVLAARTQAVRVAHATTTTRHRVSALLLEAVAEHRLGQGAAALVAASRAAELAHPQGLVQGFAQLPTDELRAVAAQPLTPGGPTPHAVGLLRDLLEGQAIDQVAAVPASLTVVELTERERAVLTELVSTPSLDVVAARLFVSPNTVKSQVRSLYRKLGVHNRDDALVTAYRRGLLHA
ncbi:LuxR C-terminal-related transcriptional regulator [Cellulomonas soli]|uniref:helix-turn-helix transcriptional regulator n=1 Tax=Cellulomonas soli TaxID=931535 RepID=UPI003F86DFE3